MNKVIKDLIDQASFIYAEYERGEQVVKQDMFDKEKFARLLIQECVKVVGDAVARREPASTYTDKIVNHFYFDEEDRFNRIVRDRARALAIAHFGKELADEWWTRPNKHWNNKTPNEVPVKEVYQYLMREL